MIDLFSGHFLETSLQGRIGWLDELKTINGKTFIKFNVACHISKTVEWVSCIAFDNKAKLISEFAQKGTVLNIKGIQKTDNWIDKQTEQKKSKTNIIVKNLGFISNTKSEIDFRNNDNLVDNANFELSDEDNQLAIDVARQILESEGFTIKEGA